MQRGKRGAGNTWRRVLVLIASAGIPAREIARLTGVPAEVVEELWRQERRRRRRANRLDWSAADWRRCNTCLAAWQQDRGYRCRPSMASAARKSFERRGGAVEHRAVWERCADDCVKGNSELYKVQ